MLTESYIGYHYVVLCEKSLLLCSVDDFSQIKYYHCIMKIIFEPPHGKTNNLHK